MSLIEDIKEIRSGKEELKQFGRAGGIFFLALLIGVLLLKRELHLQFLAVSAGFWLGGYLVPQALKPIYLVWMPLATTLGWIITRLILVAAFFLTVTPIGLLGRLFRKSFLDLKFKDNAGSYWIKQKSNPSDKNACERQF